MKKHTKSPPRNTKKPSEQINTAPTKASGRSKTVSSREISQSKREAVYKKYAGKCAYSGRDLSADWTIDHVIPRALCKIANLDGVNDINNLVPCQQIINEMKGELTLFEFRQYLSTLHTKVLMIAIHGSHSLHELRANQRIIALAHYFRITASKPFTGKFYFEKL